MERRQLGSTGLQVSTVGFGAWGIAGGLNWGPQDRQDSIAALRAGFEGGVNFFDTAEMYGDGYSEQLIAEALGSVRDDILIASKVTSRRFAPDELARACEESLRRLRTDRIDLYQLHWPNHERPIDETLGVLARLKAQGKIRACGVSNFGPLDLAEALATGRPVAANQMAYSLLFRAVEFDVLPACTRANVAVLGYSPLMQGLLAGKFAAPDEVPVDRARTRHFAGTRPKARHGEPGCEAETFETLRHLTAVAGRLREPLAHVALAWLLAQPGVTSVLAGARNAAQARDNARAGGLVLPSDVVAELSAITDPLKQRLGTNCDQWQTPSRIR